MGAIFVFAANDQKKPLNIAHIIGKYFFPRFKYWFLSLYL
jgi:hypothetical protein